MYSGDGPVIAALAQLTELSARAPLKFKRLHSRTVESQMDPMSMKHDCFRKLQQALSDEAIQDRADGRAEARARYKASLKAEEAAAAGASAPAGILRSGTSRSGDGLFTSDTTTIVPTLDKLDPLGRL